MIKIDFGENNKLVELYLQTIPNVIINSLEESVELIKLDVTERGGHYYSGPRIVAVGPTTNTWGFLEILGHELGHGFFEYNTKNISKFIKEIFPEIIKRKDNHWICDSFSQYILYNNGFFYDSFKKEYGERDEKLLKKLYEEINEFDKKMKISLPKVFNKNARFLRI